MDRGHGGLLDRGCAHFLIEAVLTSTVAIPAARRTRGPAGEDPGAAKRPAARSQGVCVPSGAARQDFLDPEGTSAEPGRGSASGLTTRSNSSSVTPLARAACLRVRSWSMAH